MALYRPPRSLATLTLAVRRSRPPCTMPGYYRCWRRWWRVAIALLRRAGMRDRAARDAVHDRLMQHYRDAALLASEEGT